MKTEEKDNKKVRKLASKTSFRTNCGGDGGIRTLDLTDANRTLSQLSYAPVCLLVSFKHYITNFPFVKKNIDYIQNL